MKETKDDQGHQTFSGAKSNDLRKEFNQLKKLISNLKSKLNKLNLEKKNVSQESKDIRNKIGSNVNKIKQLKKERDSLTKKVKELKKERDKLNTLVKEKSTQKKEIDQKRNELLQKLNLKEDPDDLKKQIKKLEFKIETEPMFFNKEKQITKTIKELKKKYQEVEKLGGVWNEVNQASQLLFQTKQKAEEAHQEIQKSAQESQKRHEEINVIFNETKQLKDKVQPYAEQLLKSTIGYETVKRELGENLKKFNELSQHFKEEDRKSFQTLIKEKTAAVKEKIKKGKKLNTEDILTFQASKD